MGCSSLKVRATAEGVLPGPSHTGPPPRQGAAAASFRTRQLRRCHTRRPHRLAQIGRTADPPPASEASCISSHCRRDGTWQEVRRRNPTDVATLHRAPDDQGGWQSCCPRICEASWKPRWRKRAACLPAIFFDTHDGSMPLRLGAAGSGRITPDLCPLPGTGASASRPLASCPRRRDDERSTFAKLVTEAIERPDRHGRILDGDRACGSRLGND